MSSSEALSRETSTRLSTLFHVDVPGGSLLSLDAQSRWVLIHGILQAYDSSWKLPGWPVIVGQKSDSLPWSTSVVPNGPNEPPKDDWLSKKKDMAEIKRWITLLNVGHLLPKKFEFEDGMKFIHFVGTLMDKIGATLGTTKLMANVRVIVKKQARSNALQIGGKTNRDHLNRISTNSVVKSEDESDPLDKENVVPAANSVTSEDEDNDESLANIIPSGLQLPRTPMVRSTSCQSVLAEEDEEEEEEKPLVLEEESMNEKSDDRANEKESPRNLIPTGKEIPRTPYVNPYRPLPDENEVSTEDEKKKTVHALNETFDAKAEEMVHVPDEDNLNGPDEKLNVPQCQTTGLLDQTFDVIEGKPKVLPKDDSKTDVSKDAKPLKSRRKPAKAQLNEPDHLKVQMPDIDNGDERSDLFKHDLKPCVDSAPGLQSANVGHENSALEEVNGAITTDVAANAKDIEPERKAKKGRKAKSTIEKDTTGEQDEKEGNVQVDKLVPKTKRTAKIKAISRHEVTAKTTEAESGDQNAQVASEKVAKKVLTKPPKETKRKGKTAPSQDALVGVSSSVSEISEEKTGIDPDKVEAKKIRTLRVSKPAVKETEENGKSVKLRGKPTKKEREALVEAEINELSKAEPEKVKKGRKPKMAASVVAEKDEPIELMEPETKSAPKAKRNTKNSVKPSPESAKPEGVKSIDVKKRGLKRGQKSAEDEQFEEIETKKKTRSNKNDTKATEEPVPVVESMDEEAPNEEKEDEPALPARKGRNPRVKAKKEDKVAPKVKKQPSQKVDEKAAESLEPEESDEPPEPKVKKQRKSRAKKAQSTQVEKVAENPTKFPSDDEPQEEEEEATEADLEKDQDMKTKSKQKRVRKDKVEPPRNDTTEPAEEKATKGRKARAKPSHLVEVVEKPKRGSKKAIPEKPAANIPNVIEDVNGEKEVSFREEPSTKRAARAKTMKHLVEKPEDESKDPVPKKTAKKRRASSLNTTETREHLKLALLKAKEAEDALNNGVPSPPKVKMVRKKGAAKKLASAAPISDQSSDKGGPSKAGAVLGQAIKEESREQKLELLDRLFDRKKQKGVGKTNNKDVNLEEPKTKLANAKRSAKSANPDNTIQESLDEMVVASSGSMNVNDGLCSTSKVEKGRKPSKKIKKSDQEAEVPPPTKTARKHSKKK